MSHRIRRLDTWTRRNRAQATRLYLGIICFQFADVHRTLAELTLALAAFERSGDVHRQAIALTYLADALTITERRFGQRLKRPRTGAERPRWVSEGLAHAQRALALYRQAGEPDDVLMALSVLVDYHTQLGDLERASRYADQAVALIHQGTAPEMRALTQATLGFVHQARGELPEAISCFRSAMAMLPGDTGPAQPRRPPPGSPGPLETQHPPLAFIRAPPQS
jgi:tetratricopeptide (TPR) repeat protein